MSGEYLSCDCSDGEPVDFQTVTNPKARKLHKCSECGGDIQPGQPYRRVAYKCDGELKTLKYCEKCDDLHDALEELGFCLLYGLLAETYKDYLEESGAVRYNNEADTYTYPSNHIINEDGKLRKYLK